MLCPFHEHRTVSIQSLHRGSTLHLRLGHSVYIFHDGLALISGIETGFLLICFFRIQIQTVFQGVSRTGLSVFADFLSGIRIIGFLAAGSHPGIFNGSHIEAVDDIRCGVVVSVASHDSAHFLIGSGDVPGIIAISNDGISP